MPSTAPLFIDVITTGTNPDEPPLQERRINWSNPQSRKWFDGHMTWAIHNGLCVHTTRAAI